MFARTEPSGTGTPRTGLRSANGPGTVSRRGASGEYRCLDCCPTTCPAWRPSSWAAARRTCLHRWHDVATVVGIDNSEAQLATARRLAAEHGVALRLIHGNAESVPYP